MEANGHETNRDYSQEELNEYSKRNDIEGIERVVVVANYLKENP